MRDLAHLRPDRVETVGKAELQHRDAACPERRHGRLGAVLPGEHEVRAERQHGLRVGADFGQALRLLGDGGERRVARERAECRDLLGREQGEKLIGAEVQRDDALGGAGGRGEQERSQHERELC